MVSGRRASLQDDILQLRAGALDLHMPRTTDAHMGDRRPSFWHPGPYLAQAVQFRFFNGGHCSTRLVQMPLVPDR